MPPDKVPAEEYGLLPAYLDFLSSSDRERLADFIRLLGAWQQSHNLVSARTLKDAWTRHIVDSLQLIPQIPDDAHTWIDLGSGAGFPGLAVAVALRDHADISMTLVEANQKKCAFMRAVARQTQTPVEIANVRIENLPATRQTGYDVVSARALAPLIDLLSLAKGQMGEKSVLLAPKGQDFVHEHETASKYWDYDLLVSKSVTDPGGCIAVISRVRERGVDQNG